MSDDESYAQHSFDARTAGMTPLEFRGRFGLTQEELGRVVGRSRQAVGSWETGRNSPDPAAQRLMDRLSQATHDEIRRMAAERADERGFSHWLAEAKTSPDVRELKTASGGEVLDITPRAARYSATLGELIELARSAPIAAPVLGSIRDPLNLPLGLTALGARSETLPRAAEVAHAVFSDEPTVQWLSDGESVTEAPVSLTLESVARRTAGCTMRVSRRLMKLAGEGRVQSLIAARILSALSRAVEAAAIAGDGVGPHMTGILNHPNAVQYLPDSGFSYSDLVSMIELLETAGIPLSSVGAVCSPVTAKSLRLTPIEIGTERFMLGGARLNLGELGAGIPTRVIDGIGDNVLLLGSFSELIVYSSGVADMRMVEHPDGSHQVYAFLDAGVSLARPGVMVWSATA